MKEAILNGTIGFPGPGPLPKDDNPIPYFIIGDDAFGVRTWLMEPFSKRDLEVHERIFNYRLSRARRIVENVPGILDNKCGCLLLTTMGQSPKRVETIVLSA